MSAHRRRARPVPLVRVLAAACVLLACASPAAKAQSDLPLRPTRSGSTVFRSSGRCGECHPAERVAFEKSPHATEDLRCISCHGGNDETTLESAAHAGGGWRGHLGRRDIPPMCASCHADENRMRPYDLPVDQYALYQTSGHGQRLRAGNLKVAVCSDCHGAHEILAPSDPNSRVYITNIPRTCGGCHSDSVATADGTRRSPYHDYLASIHAQQLLDEGNLRAPTCVGCHGVHGAAPSAVGDINKICGRCHTAERRYFLAGPHAAGMARKKLGECGSCHGEHAISRASLERLASVCTDCHEKGSADARMGGALLADFRTASAAIEGAEVMVARAEAVPLQTDDYRARVEEARTYLREAQTAAHAVQPELMSAFTVRARSVGTEVQTEIQGKLRNLLVEKLVLIVFWFYVLVTVGILRRFRDRSPRVK